MQHAVMTQACSGRHDSGLLRRAHRIRTAGACFRSWFCCGYPRLQEEPNALYNGVLSGVNIEIGEHNAGAVGVKLRGAQGSGLEDVAVTFLGGAAPDAGMAGVMGGCTMTPTSLGLVIMLTYH